MEYDKSKRIQNLNETIEKYKHERDDLKARLLNLTPHSTYGMGDSNIVNNLSVVQTDVGPRFMGDKIPFREVIEIAANIQAKINILEKWICDATDGVMVLEESLKNPIVGD